MSNTLIIDSLNTLFSMSNTAVLKCLNNTDICIVQRSVFADESNSNIFLKMFEGMNHCLPLFHVWCFAV